MKLIAQRVQTVLDAPPRSAHGDDQRGQGEQQTTRPPGAG